MISWIPLPIIRALRWLKRCPECLARPDRHWLSITPRWDTDPIVLRFGWLDGRCARCGTEVAP